MKWLLLTSLIWAFLFGLIGHVLKGLDPFSLAFVRRGLATLIFLPRLRYGALSTAARWRGIIIGAVQYGGMYLALFLAYAYLQSHEVALFTIFTPIYVAWIHDAFEQRFHGRYTLAAVAATIGAGIVTYAQWSSPGFRRGFFLMQLSNLCFAFGQVAYRRWRKRTPRPADDKVFGWLYLGAWAVATGAWVGRPGAAWTWPSLSPQQTAAVVYLGIVASGLAFFLWNFGATQVSAGALAVWNNLKIPLAVLVSLVVFREPADGPRLAVGGGLCLLALGLCDPPPPSPRPTRQSASAAHVGNDGDRGV